MVTEVLNPQQSAFLEAYLDPQSETWSNATQSALKAGYTQEYADNIMSAMPKWLSRVLDDKTLVQKAIDNLSEFVGNRENDNYRWDATKFVLTTLGRNKFSTRSELSGPGGKDLFINEKDKEKSNQLVRDYLSNTGDDSQSS